MFSNGSHNPRRALLRQPLALFAAGVVLLAAIPAIAQKPHRSPSLKCTVAFTNTGVEGLVDDGKGLYADAVDGTTCAVLGTGELDAGDFLFTLNNGGKRAKTIRTALLYLDNPVAGSQSRGLWVVGDLFHLKIKELGRLDVGETILKRAGFHVPYLGENYKFRYGWELDDGTALTSITRNSATVWTVRSVDTHVARLWTGGGYGDGTVYQPLGDYVAPFEMTITLK